VRRDETTVPFTAGPSNDLFFAERHPLGSTLTGGDGFDFNAFEVPII